MDANVIAVDREMIKGKARSAYVRGVARDDHGFNWHALAAITVWQREWDKCAAAHAQLTFMLPKLREVSPP